MPATIARTGVQHYPEDGLVEYRPPEEVFSDASLASLAGIPVTLRHPAAGVTPENARGVQVGHASDLAPESRVKIDGSPHEWVRAALYIAAGDVQDAVERGDAGTISCGYSCELDHTPGVAPDGTKYDAVQRNIRFNHVAILTADQQPRAGGDAKLRLDSQGKPMKTVIIDGVEFEHGSDRHLAKIQSDAAASVKAQADRADAAEAQRDANKERADKAELAASPERIDALVEGRMALLARAAKLLPAKYETKGKSDAQVRADAVAAKLGADKIAGKSEAYVEARFDMLTDGDAPAQYHAPVAAPRADATSINDSDDAFRKSLAKKSAASGSEEE